MSVSCEGTARANPSPKFRALQWPYAAFGRQCGNRQVKRSLLRTYPQLQQVSAPRPPVSESTTQWMAFRGRWQTLGIVWSQGTNSQMPRKLSLVELPQKFAATGKEPSKDGRADQRQRYHQRRDYRALMSANELAGAIGDRVRSSTNRLVLQGPLQIVNKRLYRGVALLRILLQRLRHNRVEIAAQQPAQLVGRRGAFPGIRDCGLFICLC